MGLVLLLSIPVLVGLGMCVHDALLRPSFRRLATRNVHRRWGEAALVVMGSTFGTAIICAAFVVGDSFGTSIRDVARTTLGPIDVIVRIRPEVAPSGPTLDSQVAELEARVHRASVPGIDGTLAATSADAVLSNDLPGRDRLADARGCLLEVDLDAGRGFGSDPSITGLSEAGASPVPGQAIVNAATAEKLGLEEGDVLVAGAYGQDARFTVRQIVPEVGIAGYCGAIVAPGTIADLVGSAPTGTPQPPAGMVLVSNNGGVFDAAAASEDTVIALRSALAGVPGVEIEPVKLHTLEDADEAGSTLRSLFSGIGGFSVIAGILLLVNLFVMLAEERKVELGMLRAAGMKRNHVWRTFSLEGAIYSGVAAVLGAALGVGVGALIIVGTNSIFHERDDRFTVSLSVRPSTLVFTAFLGCGISLLTVWGTSLRIARLNIISAIRDLPDPRRAGRRLGSLLACAAGVLVGGVVLAAGVGGDAPLALMVGPPVALFSLVGLLGRILPRRPVTFVLSAAVIGWCLLVFEAFDTEMAEPGIDVFVTMGVILVAAAVTIATTLDPLWDRVTLVLTEHGKGLATRLGLAYPLSRAFRTGMLLGMYSLVVFTMTFIGTFAAILESQTSTAVADISAGFDLVVRSNPANPISDEQLLRQPDVEGVAGLVSARGEFTNRYREQPTEWRVTGFERDLLAYGAPVLAERDDRFETDTAAFEATLADPSLIVVDDRFLQTGAAPREEAPAVGDVVQLQNASGRRQALTVVGVLRSDFAFVGSMVQADLARSFLAPLAVENVHYLKVTAGSDPEAVATRLNTELTAFGVDAQTFQARVEDSMSRQTGFMRLMQVYLGFGLLIGIAGLGVVMVRAVRERRREIGMLRAMGFSSRVVRRAFLVEAGFIATQAVLTGVGLGLLTCYQVAVNSGAFSNFRLTFTVPWVTIAIIGVVPFLASLAAALLPAERAARISPAIALRTDG